jgi:hypothetical protein
MAEINKTTAPSFISLPFDVLDAIAQHSLRADLKNLRLASRQFSRIAERWLYRHTTLENDKESQERHRSLRTSDFTRHVRKIIFVTRFNFYGYEYSSDEDCAIYEGFMLALHTMGRFPCVNAVEWHFPYMLTTPYTGISNKDDEALRYQLMQEFFEGLEDPLHPTPNLKSLTIVNLQDIDRQEKVSTSKAFKSVLGRIEDLKLYIAATDKYPLRYARPHKVFNSDDLHDLITEFPEKWLAPFGNLKKLTLHCELPWGVYPMADLQKIDLPRLRYLELGNYAFAWDWQLDWICGLKELRSLILDGCKIISKRDANHLEEKTAAHDLLSGKKHWRYKARWADLFQELGSRLPLLREFVFGSELREVLNAPTSRFGRYGDYKDVFTIWNLNYDSDMEIVGDCIGKIMGLYPARYVSLDRSEENPWMWRALNKKEDKRDWKALK